MKKMTLLSMPVKQMVLLTVRQCVKTKYIIYFNIFYCIDIRMMIVLHYAEN